MDGFQRVLAVVLFATCMLLLIDCSYSMKGRRRPAGCGEHGTETATGGCNCNIGWTGPHCEEHDCKHGGTWDHHHHHCKCPVGYSGTYCEISPGTHQTSAPALPGSHLCNSSPCHNGGHCYHDHTQFFCACLPGYTGTICTERIITQPPPTTPKDLCAHVMCYHGGHCYHDNHRYYCRCADGYTGSHCETRIVITTACSSSPCKNGGHCYVDGTDFFCQCPTKYTGKTCEALAPTSVCSSSPCKNGGHCYGDGTDFFCQCPPQYTGKTCETTNIDYCAFKPCVHGLCLSLQSDFFCYCDQGYKGKTCREGNATCTPSSCMNGGHCYHDDVTYFCDCPPGFSGQHCEIDLSTLPSTTVNAVQTTAATLGAIYQTCNDIGLVETLNNGRITHSDARNCTSNTNKMSDAIILKHCNGRNTVSWKQGVQVAMHCDTLPKYTAIAQFHNGVPTSKTGVFLVCATTDSFEYFTQTCDDDFKLSTMSWPESETFYTVEY